MKKVKKFLSLILAIFLLLGCLPMSASAYNTDPSVNCTYIAWKMATDRGYYVSENWGNGADWYQNAKNAGYHVEGPNYGLIANSIACWGGGLNGWGHVAYVLGADDNTVTICEGGTGGDPRTWSPSWETMKNGMYAKDEYGNRYPMYLQGYIILSKSVSENITLDNPWVDNISDTGATIHSVIRNNRQRVRAYGLEVWEKNTKKNVIDHWENIPSNNQTLNHIDIWVNTIDELGVSLKPGTEYGCFFYIDEGGKVFSKETYFKTKGTAAPSVATLTTDKWGPAIGENITFTCTSDTATGYILEVSRGGTRVLTQEVSSGKFTTSFQEPGEYSAYVNAYNSAGTLKSGKITFTVFAGNEELPGGGETDLPTPTPPKPTVSGFSDVFEDDYYADSVKWAVENEITSGTSATKFSPNSGCTRAQAVTFLWRAAGSPEPASATNPFTDVKSGDYFYKAVLWAVENGVTSGTSATKFSPNDKCTRGQIVTFQHRAAGSPAAGTSGSFGDVASDAYYAGAVAWAVENNITSGTSATKFSPNGKCTRGQIVTFLYRGSGT